MTEPEIHRLLIQHRDSRDFTTVGTSGPRAEWFKDHVRSDAPNRPASSTWMFVEHGQAVVLRRIRGADGTTRNDECHGLIGHPSHLTFEIAVGFAAEDVSPEVNRQWRIGTMAPLGHDDLLRLRDRYEEIRSQARQANPIHLTTLVAEWLRRPNVQLPVTGLADLESPLPLLDALRDCLRDRLTDRVGERTARWTFSTFETRFDLSVGHFPGVVFLPDHGLAQGSYDPIRRPVRLTDPPVADQWTHQAEQMVAVYLAAATSAGEPPPVSDESAESRRQALLALQTGPPGAAADQSYRGSSYLQHTTPVSASDRPPAAERRSVVGSALDPRRLSGDSLDGSRDREVDRSRTGSGPASPHSYGAAAAMDDLSDVALFNALAEAKDAASFLAALDQMKRREVEGGPDLLQELLKTAIATEAVSRWISSWIGRRQVAAAILRFSLPPESLAGEDVLQLIENWIVNLAIPDRAVDDLLLHVGGEGRIALKPAVADRYYLRLDLGPVSRTREMRPPPARSVQKQAPFRRNLHGWLAATPPLVRLVIATVVLVLAVVGLLNIT